MSIPPPPLPPVTINIKFSVQLRLTEHPSQYSTLPNQSPASRVPALPPVHVHVHIHSSNATPPPITINMDLSVKLPQIEHLSQYSTLPNQSAASVVLALPPIHVHIHIHSLNATNSQSPAVEYAV